MQSAQPFAANHWRSKIPFAGSVLVASASTGGALLTPEGAAASQVWSVPVPSAPLLRSARQCQKWP